ncbi:hypothetical protein D9M72_355100 [compost metagenome]
MRVERNRDFVARQLGLKFFRSLRIFAGAGVQVELAVGEGQADRRVPFGDQGDAPDSLDQFLSLHGGVDRGGIREQ